MSVHRRIVAGREQGGSALIIVLLMIGMLGVLTLTLASLSVNNLAGARRAAQSGVALNAADAGLAQAVAYLRGTGVKALSCSPSCSANPWGNSTSPASVTTGLTGAGAASYKVWIEPVAPYPANSPGVYRVHSLGVAGAGSGRATTMEVTYAPEQFPLGVFGKSISGGGNSGVHYESMFTTGCVYQRSKIAFSGADILNNIPAGMHSSQLITDSTGSGVYCPTTKKPIHDGTVAGFCNPAYPNDQDSRGGSLAGTACQGAAGAYPQTSLIVDDADLFAKYKLTAPPLSDAQLERMKTVAISQGNYWTSSSGWTSPTQANAVMYFDLLKTDPGGLVDLNNVTGFGRAPNLAATDPSCGAKSLVIIITGGNARLNSNQQLAASVFVLGDDPYGNLRKANGTANFIGTVYANNIDLTGTADMWMDTCFATNLSPALFDVRTSNYREVDR